MSFPLLAASVFVLILMLLIIRSRIGIPATDEWPEAEAVILSITINGYEAEEKLGATIVMQVHPEWGKSFVAECEELISAQQLAMLQPGAILTVRYQSKRKLVAIIKDSVRPRLAKPVRR